jgi:hypothetical protein
VGKPADERRAWEDYDTLRDVIAVAGHALTRPLTVDKRCKRDHNPVWFQNNRSEDNHHVAAGPVVLLQAPEAKP